ncbi:hypothetical protein, partial [Salmonella enterica]|uniref:hypothetical protein n=1 Tax=Salmonella enterica TaxID=28901 RepID=UPI001C7263A6
HFCCLTCKLARIYGLICASYLRFILAHANDFRHDACIPGADGTLFKFSMDGTSLRARYYILFQKKPGRRHGGFFIHGSVDG